MGRPPRIIFPSAIYHAMTRGDGRQRIFFEAADWERFLDELAELKRTRPFRLYAFCLMSNHLHLLIESLETSISKLMAILLGRYAKYINAKLGRTGHVFQERFKAPLCLRDARFLQTVRYIHRNPVEAGIVADPADWPYSGHNAYLGADSRGLVDTELLLSMLHPDPERAREAYEQFVRDGATSGPIQPVPAPPPSRREAPVIDLRTGRRSLPELADTAARAAGMSPELLRSGTKVRRVCRARRDVLREALAAGYSLTEIAELLSVTASALSKSLADLN